MIVSGEFSIGISVSQAYLHYISYSHVRQVVSVSISVSTFLFKTKHQIKEYSHFMKEKRDESYLNCLTGIFNV